MAKENGIVFSKRDTAAEFSKWLLKTDSSAAHNPQKMLLVLRVLSEIMLKNQMTDFQILENTNADEIIQLITVLENKKHTFFHNPKEYKVYYTSLKLYLQFLIESSSISEGASEAILYPENKNYETTQQPSKTNTESVLLLDEAVDTAYASTGFLKTLETKYPDFAKFCTKSGITSSDQLSNTDYVAFRTSMGLSRDEVAKIREFVESTNCVFSDIASSENKLPTPLVLDDDIQVNISSLEIDKPELEKQLTIFDDTNENLVSSSEIESIKLQPSSTQSKRELTLAEAFGTNANEFQNVGISKLDLKARPYNCLMRYGYKTLSNILELTESEIFSIGNMGRKSVDDIVTKVQAYLNIHMTDLSVTNAPNTRNISANLKKAIIGMMSEKEYNTDYLTDDEKETLNTILECADEVGKDILILVLHSPKEITEICNVLDIFSKDILVLTAYKDQISQKILQLPVDIRNHKALPFITAFEASGNKTMYSLGELCDSSLTIGKIYKLCDVADDSIDIAVLMRTLNRFVDWLDFDIENVIISITKETEAQIAKNGSFALDVLNERNKGATLDEIAKNYAVTRERIRQIESKGISRALKALCQQRYDVVMLYFAFFPNEKTIKPDNSPDVFRNFLKEFWGAFKKYPENSYYCYDKNLDAIVLKIHGNNIREQNITAQTVKEALNDFPPFMHESEFMHRVRALAEKFKYPVDVIVRYSSETFCKDGSFYHSGKIPVVFVCGYVLKERFPAGFKIGDNYESDRFRQYIKELFGIQASEITNRALDAKIGEIGCLCDRGKYVHPDLFNVIPEIMEQIYTYIDESPRRVLPYAEIYDALKSAFSGSMITNRYALQGAIKKYGSKYKSNRDYICKDNSASFIDEVDAFVEERGIVHKSEIMAEFPAIDESRLGQITSRCDNTFNIDNGYYIHISQFDLQPEDYFEIKPYIERKCATIPVNIRTVWDEMYSLFPQFFLRNDFDDRNKLFAALNYMFRDDFNFSRPYIAKLGVDEVTNKSVILQHIAEYDRIDISELMDICSDNNINFQSSGYLCRLLKPEFIRINKNTLLRRELSDITDEIVSKVVDVINTMLDTREYIAATLITDYLWYPTIDLEWNPFLLESIISESKKINIIYSNCDPMKRPTSVFINEKYAGDTYTSFLKKILTDELHKGSFNSKEDMRVWLIENGLIEKKLPEFIEGARYFYADSKGVHCREDDEDV